MTGIITTEYDLTLLTKQVSNLKGFLLGKGATEGACQNLLRVQAGLLAWEISKQVGPKNITEGKKKVDRSLSLWMNSSFSKRAGEEKYTVFERPSQLQGVAYPDYYWLTAGPNYLLGIKQEDMRTDATPGYALKMLRDQQKAGLRGDAYIDMGTRPTRGGKSRQHIYRLNRTRLSTATYKGLARMLYDQLGQLRASFAATAVNLKVDRVVPPFVSRHFGTVKRNQKQIFNDALLNHPTNPSIEFGSRAKGVVSNPIVVEAIQGAVKTRTFKLAEAMNRILSGATYVWNTGATYFPKNQMEDE